ncbi:hypothetical protein [Stieleria varia]|nr:hypothetical protein [Stieleria varia]
MTKEYVQAVGRMAYIWGWPLVNLGNRSVAFSSFKQPVSLFFSFNVEHSSKNYLIMNFRRACKNIGNGVAMLSLAKATTSVLNHRGSAFTESIPVTHFGIWIALAIVGAAPVYGQVADKIFRGGNIVTVNDAEPIAETVAIEDRKILAVGSNDEIVKHQATETEVVDLAGRALLPGFIDGQGHCFATGIQAASANLLAPPD